MKQDNVRGQNAKGQEIEQLIEKKLQEIINGKITVIVQDNKPIQINVDQSTLI